MRQGALLTLCSLAVAAAAPPKAIVMILADDYGWWNIEMDGHNVAARTPHLHRLSNEGVRLDRHYVYKYCSPTRSSLLTGRLPIHVNQNNEGNTLTSPSGADIRMTTIAQKLKSAQPSFQTHAIGKWHCGSRTAANLPINRGFDSHLGFLKGMEDHFDQRSNFDGYQKKYLDLWHDNGPEENVLNGTYSVFRDAARAVDIINDFNPTTDPPLYLHVMFQVAHSPYQVPEQYLDPTIENECRQKYHGMATAMDEGIGNITAALKAKNAWQDTLLIFTADNGAPTHGNSCGNNYPLRGGKTSDFEGGVRTSAFMSGGYVPVEARGGVHTGLMHIADWYATLSTLVGVDPEDTGAAVPTWAPERENWNCGDELVGAKMDEELGLNECLAFCSAYKFAGHWTKGATTCRCYTGCDGHATDVGGGLTNEVYSQSEGVPPVDGVDQWASLITPNASTSARNEIPLAFCTNIGGASDGCVSSALGVKDVTKYDQGALIADGGHWKVLFGDQHGFGFFTGPAHPNGTKDYEDAGCPNGCLFDLWADPTEHIDVKVEEPEVFARLKARLEEWGRTVFQTNYTDAPLASQCLSEEDAAEKYNGHIGPQCSPDTSLLV